MSYVKAKSNSLVFQMYFITVFQKVMPLQCTYLNFLYASVTQQRN